MTKARIFIAIHYMEIGGAEISLVGLLQALDYERVDVDLFIYSHQGELMQFIPREVNLLPEIRKYSTTEMPLVKVLKMGYPDIVIARLLAKIKYHRFRKRNPSKISDDLGLYQYMANHVTPLLSKISKGVDYDLTINFCGMHNVVLDKVAAKKKIAWIHTDYSMVNTDRNCDYKLWRRFDHIVSISPDVTKSFISIYPSLKDKIIEIENILLPEFVRSRAEAFDARGELAENAPTSSVNLLSVGRYCEAKNYDNVPAIARSIIENHGIKDLRWFIIGYGGDEALIRRKIAEAGMERHVILLGKRDNPYPYIKACDIYVQPSRYEGKSVTVREAQMLCKPVVVTNYPTASSQIRHGIDGVIVPLDNDGCARGIADFIADSPLQQRITDYLAIHDYGNEAEVNKIYQLL